MKRELRCVHNTAKFPEHGVTCDLREPNSLCKDCKKFRPRYPSYSCQECGESIGWLGRLIEFVFFKLIKHKCKNGK